MEVVKEESPIDSVSFDDKILSSDTNLADSPPCSPLKKKRKKVASLEDEENYLRKSNKKLKKPFQISNVVDSDNSVRHTDEMANRTKIGGNISITSLALKRVLLVKPERLRKKGHVWSRDFLPAPDGWSSQEDALLCATIHEYGTNWSFASDIICGITGGGIYRGRFRHPVHCSERFRELFFKYVLSAMDGPNTEKTSSASGKALLKVTEVKQLLQN